MKIDLFKLNNFNEVSIDEDISFDESYFETTDIRGIKDLHVKGTLKINYEDEVDANLEVSGQFILPCAITLDDVPYDFNTNIEENLGKFEDFYNNNKNSLDILPIIWENIVLEVPIRVVKKGVEIKDIKGNGWEFDSSQE